jgi:hypothetical protein
MNPIEEQLDRLLKSAARAPRHLPCQAPLALRRQMVTQWRRGGAGRGDVAQFLLPSLRWAAAGACLLMFLSLALNYRAIVTAENEEIAIANSAIDLTLLP